MPERGDKGMSEAPLFYEWFKMKQYIELMLGINRRLHVYAVAYESAVSRDWGCQQLLKNKCKVAGDEVEFKSAVAPRGPWNHCRKGINDQGRGSRVEPAWFMLRNWTNNRLCGCTSHSFPWNPLQSVCFVGTYLSVRMLGERWLKSFCLS